MYTYTHKKEKKDKTLILVIESSKMDELNRLSKKLKMSKAQLVRNCIDVALSDLHLIEATGLLTVGVKTYDLIESAKKAIFNNQYSLKKKKMVIDL